MDGEKKAICPIPLAKMKIVLAITGGHTEGILINARLSLEGLRSLMPTWMS